MLVVIVLVCACSECWFVLVVIVLVCGSSDSVGLCL